MENINQCAGCGDETTNLIRDEFLQILLCKNCSAFVREIDYNPERARALAAYLMSFGRPSDSVEDSAK